MADIDSWFLKNLVCPRTHVPLHFERSKNSLISESGYEYPVVDGVPIMLIDDQGLEHTLSVAEASMKRAKGEIIDQRAPKLYLESLAVDDVDKKLAVQLAQDNKSEIDPVIAVLIGATNGNLYKDLIGNLKEIPIPDLRLPRSKSANFLDIGCSWGRWSIAAAEKGYASVGIDPSLSAIMAARRLAEKMNLSIKYLVADARYLPFKSGIFDFVFSYSVFQHFNDDDVIKCLHEVYNVLKLDGESLIQMANKRGLRSFYSEARRGFKKAKGFEVRYRSLIQMKNIFETIIGKTLVSSDCYFGLGLQAADIRLMTEPKRMIIHLSELLRALSEHFPFLVSLADSVYLSSMKTNGH